jgi:ribonucleoside-diphosphate reductase alpha chain
MRNTFAVSSDITADEHIHMQAALQAFVDNSLSKTVNFPSSATKEDVANVYMQAWKLNCRGTTVYVTGSRDTVVLETKATAEKKNGESETAAAVAAVAAHAEAYTDEEMVTLWHETKKPRPRSLVGYTYQVPTPLGKAFITINENGGSQPFEVFINTAKAGSDTAAVSEAIGRLVSYILRLSSPILPIERLQDVSRQLTGIGGGRAMGFGPNRVRSLPDGIAQILKDYLQQWQDRESGGDHRKAPKANTSSGAAATGATFSLDMGQLALPVEPLAPQVPKPKEGLEQKIGDLCPECGVASLVNEEGCRKCYSCGYSEC